jgi:hypothetical protein
MTQAIAILASTSDSPDSDAVTRSAIAFMRAALEHDIRVVLHADTTIVLAAIAVAASHARRDYVEGPRGMSEAKPPLTIIPMLRDAGEERIYRSLGDADKAEVTMSAFEQISFGISEPLPGPAGGGGPPPHEQWKIALEQRGVRLIVGLGHGDWAAEAKRVAENFARGRSARLVTTPVGGGLVQEPWGDLEKVAGEGLSPPFPPPTGRDDDNPIDRGAGWLQAAQEARRDAHVALMSEALIDQLLAPGGLRFE